MKRIGPHERGLTLLEVLAATMIFALVMTVLVGTSTTAVHRSGVAARRLEASLLADAIVADLEIEMRKQIAPVVQRSEWTTEDEIYVIRLQNRSIQEALADPAGAIADETGRSGADSNAPGATRIGGGAGIGTLLAGELPEVAKHLRQYDIEVVWIGADGPESLTRTTFAFDWQAAKIEYASLFEGAGDTREGGGANDAGEDPDGRNPAVPQIPDLRQRGR